MVAPSYTGETAVGECPAGHLVEIAADRDLFGSRGHCPACHRQVEFSVLFDGDSPVSMV